MRHDLEATAARSSDHAPLFHPAPGALLADRYVLVEKIASGGMGSIWAAHHVRLDMPVAIKFMDPRLAMNAAARARFEREARAAARLRSPQVVAVLDHAVEGATPYIVMELLAGEDLGAVMRREGPMTIARAAELLIPICDALGRAHALGVAHRDLKPSNVFLARGPVGGVSVKLLDFGLAKEPSSESPTATRDVLGSPHFMSPEQTRTLKDTDARTDVWALGVLLFQMLTGRRPFDGKTASDILVSVCFDRVPRPSDLAPHLGPRADELIAWALARDTSKRCPDARAFAAALSALAAAEAPASAAATDFDDAPTAIRSVATLTDAPRAFAASRSFGSASTVRDGAAVPTRKDVAIAHVVDEASARAPVPAARREDDATDPLLATTRTGLRRARRRHTLRFAAVAVLVASVVAVASFFTLRVSTVRKVVGAQAAPALTT